MAELIPLPVLFGNPERVMPRISPDGTQLAWIAPHEGVLNVWLAPVSPETGLDLDVGEGGDQRHRPRHPPVRLGP